MGRGFREINSVAFYMPRARSDSGAYVIPKKGALPIHCHRSLSNLADPIDSVACQHATSMPSKRRPASCCSLARQSATLSFSHSYNHPPRPDCGGGGTQGDHSPAMRRSTIRTHFCPAARSKPTRTKSMALESTNKELEEARPHTEQEEQHG